MDSSILIHVMKGAPLGNLGNIFAQLPSCYEYPDCLGNSLTTFLEWFGAHFGVTIKNTIICVEVNDSMFFEFNFFEVLCCV